MFIGTYADLSGYAIGNFRVLQIAGRDRHRAPIWEAECKSCLRAHAFPHAKLMAALESRAPKQVLQCQNAACVHARTQAPRSETFSDLLRGEREQRRAVEAAARRERERIADEAAKQAKLRCEKSRYLKFAQAQIRAGVMPEDAQFMNFERWQQQSEHWRKNALQRIGEPIIYEYQQS